VTGFGGQTITILRREQTGVDDLGAAVITPLPIGVITGCRHRPIVPAAARGAGEARSEKTTEIGVGVSTNWWKSTFPVNRTNHDAVMSIQPNDALMVDGQTYQVISGSHPTTDAIGRQYKVTVISEWQASSI
jgi:hypothetical protein